MRQYPPISFFYSTLFGSAMASRGYSSGVKYRYGFNTQEKDDEVAGDGNSYTAEFWQYDCRLSRRFNLDARPNPSLSNYACFNNNPIWFSDVNGDTVEVNGSNKQKREFKKLLQNRTGDKYLYQGDLLLLKEKGNGKTTKKKSSTLAGLVELSINSTNRINYNLTYDPSNEIAYDDHESGHLDLKDLRNTKGSKIYQASMLGHIFAKRLHTPNYRNQSTRDPNYGYAHGVALVVESSIVCEMSDVSFKMISNSEDVNWSRNWGSEFDQSGNRTNREVVTSFVTTRVYGGVEIQVTVGVIWKEGQARKNQFHILKVKGVKL